MLTIDYLDLTDQQPQQETTGKSPESLNIHLARNLTIIGKKKPALDCSKTG